MADFNTATLMGNLTRDPEKKVLPSGRSVTNMDIAVNRRYKNRGTGKLVEGVDFFRIVTYGVTADNCAKFLAKGRPILANGELRQQRWQTPEGQNRSRVELQANRVQFLSGGPSSRAVAPEKDVEAGDNEVVPL